MSTAVNAVPAAKVETGILAGTRTLLYKEVLRFWKVSFQTVAAPVLTAAICAVLVTEALGGALYHIEVDTQATLAWPDYAGFAVLSFVFVAALVRETKGRRLEEMG